MSDPIEKLNRLGDALEGAPMPVPASEIRARGDRIRRRKHAVIAGASAAVVAAVAIPVAAFTFNGSDDPAPPVTPQPTISDPIASAALTAENLITSEDAGEPYGGGSWADYDTYPGDGQDVYHPCAQSSFADLGADDVWRREFNLEPATTQGWLTAIAGEFASDADARAAYDQLSTTLAECANNDTLGTRYRVESDNDVPISIGDEAHRILASYTPRPNPHANEVLETGLVLAGSRVEVVVSGMLVQDYAFEDPPMIGILPAAAERLVLGDGASVDEPPVQGDWPATIPSDFPLISGWPTADGSSEYQLEPPSTSNQAMIPSGELVACGNSAVDPGALDRLTARLSVGSDAYIRELELFPSDQEAVTYVAHLRALYQACGTEGSAPTFTTTTGDGAFGDESLDIRRASDGIGRVAITVVRIGNAVVVDLASDEANGSEVDALATATHENLADVIAAMTELESAPSADPTSDLTDPAGTTTVPDDFPLDLSEDPPPTPDSETTIAGPAADVIGVQAQSICGEGAAFPNAGSADPEHELNYSVSVIEGYDGRTIHAYPTVQDALDQMALLREQIQGCDRDSGGDGLSNRLWRSFNSDTGYDSVTFGYTYEIKNGVGAPAGQLYTVVRIGNAILALESGGEYSAEFQATAAPQQVAFAKLIAAEMCVFAEAGC